MKTQFTIQYLLYLFVFVNAKREQMVYKITTKKETQNYENFFILVLDLDNGLHILCDLCNFIAKFGIKIRGQKQNFLENSVTTRVLKTASNNVSSNGLDLS